MNYFRLSYLHIVSPHISRAGDIREIFGRTPSPPGIQSAQGICLEMPIEHAIHETAGQRRERYESRRFKQSQRKWARNHAQKLATDTSWNMSLM